MASLYRMRRSPYWWVSYRDCKAESPTCGKIVRRSTGYRIGVGEQTRKANSLCAELTLSETRMAGGGVSVGEPWNVWVLDFLTVYCKSPETLKRYKTIWRNLTVFLADRKILLPRQLSRADCHAYMEWRAKPDRGLGMRNACHNTAQTELKVLSVVMKEAVKRDFASFNPVRDLGVKRLRGRIKPEITDAVLKQIETLIQKEPSGQRKDSRSWPFKYPEAFREFLANSFAIARYQGCRLKETLVNPMEDVDLSDGPIIRFRIKRDLDHTAPLHPKLIPLFRKLKADGRTATYTRPPNPSRVWFDFLKRTGIRDIIPGACFHSLRVTVASKLARDKNVSESKAMAYVGHASTTVHRSYQRLRPRDLSDCLKALK